MLTFEFPHRRFPLLKARHKWFYERPSPADACGLAIYYHCKYKGRVSGFRRIPKFTKITDLRKTEDEIFNQLGKDTRHKIKRAIAEGLRFAVVNNPIELRDAFNQFARAKHRPLMDERVLHAYWPHLLAMKLIRDGEVLVMHAYLLDDRIKRACQSHAASLFRSTNDKQTQSLIGRANRLMHYLAMLHLKERGMELFDIGGYALNSANPELKEVNEFKDSFGGELVEESTYISTPLHLLRRLKTRINGQTHE